MPGAIITEPDIKRIRASEMVALRIAGESLEAIAKRFNCDARTVKRYLAWAGKTGIIDGAESRILDELVPLALQTYKTALENGDTFAAKHIIDKLGEMAERAEKRKDKGEDRLFEMWMKDRESKKKREGKDDQEGTDANHPGGAFIGPEERDVIDAEVLSETLGTLLGEDGPGGPEGREELAFPSAADLLRETES